MLANVVLNSLDALFLSYFRLKDKELLKGFYHGTSLYSSVGIGKNVYNQVECRLQEDANLQAVDNFFEQWKANKDCIPASLEVICRNTYDVYASGAMDEQEATKFVEIVTSALRAA